MRRGIGAVDLDLQEISMSTRRKLTELKEGIEIGRDYDAVLADLCFRFLLMHLIEESTTQEHGLLFHRIGFTDFRGWRNSSVREFFPVGLFSGS